MKPSIVALIPARAGSKRIVGKNTRLLAGHPLIAYTIAAAQESGIFDRIAVCSDDDRLWDIVQPVPPVMRIVRKEATDSQPDIEWVREAIDQIGRCDAFAILRPTSPFRGAEAIRWAWEKLQRTPLCDSVRMVRRVTEHPAKTWRIDGFGWMSPIWRGTNEYGPGDRFVPWHSSPTQSLPSAYAQTGGLEIAWTKTLINTGTISGTLIAPYITQGPEALDLNTERDWAEAERLIAEGTATLPPVPVARVQTALTEK